MATINIGSLSLSSHKGDYDNSTAYVKNDVVYYASTGNAYIAKQATTGNVPTSTAHWNIFSAGSGGIWNAGLSLGSASQKLRVNSAGNALEFFTEPAVTSDFVKLVSGSITSSTSELVMDNLFSSTYRAYKFIFTDFSPTTMNARISYQYRIGTTNQTSDYYAGGRIYYFNGSSSDGNFSETSASNGRIGNWGISSTAANAGQYEILMSDPKSTRSVKQMWYNNSNPRETDQYYSGQWGFSQWRDTGAVDGIRWFCNSGNIGYANYAVYGFKH